MLRMMIPAVAIVALIADADMAAARSHRGRAGLMAVARISGMFGLPLALGHYRAHRRGSAHHHRHGEVAVARSRDSTGDRTREAAASPKRQHAGLPLLTNAALTRAPAHGSARRALARTTFRGGLAGERRAGGPGLVIGWAGPTFWPYAQRDVLDYVLQPHAYDVFWPYAYDDVYSGLFWPYGPTAFAATGSHRPQRRDGGDAGVCAGPGLGPEVLARIGDTIRPAGAQKAALDELKNAAAASAAFLQSSCPTELPATPMARLMAMRKRVQAMLRAVLLVSPAYHAFYQSLTDAQKARFDTMPPVKESRKPEGAAPPGAAAQGAERAASAQAEAGAAAERPAASQAANPAAGTAAAPAGDPQAAQSAAAQAAAAQAVFASCGNAAQGASPLDAVEQAVQPTPEQRAALGELKQAAFKVAYLLKADCSGGPTPPPNARIDAMRLRLWSVVEALNLMRPALAKFTASLSDEQRQRLNGPLGGTRS